jgi:hypothetical protein
VDWDLLAVGIAVVPGFDQRRRAASKRQKRVCVLGKMRLGKDGNDAFLFHKAAIVTALMYGRPCSGKSVTPVVVTEPTMRKKWETSGSKRLIAAAVTAGNIIKVAATESLQLTSNPAPGPIAAARQT